MEKRLRVPFDREELKSLKAGDNVLLSGELYVARDAAHGRIAEAYEKGEELPIRIEGETVYYMGPTPARPGRIIGSAGPTTAGRMDKYTSMLLDKGLCAMIGKGKRSREVTEAITRNGAVYFAAIGGAGALLSKCIKSSEIVAYEDLGPEAILRITIEDFPAVVITSSTGESLY